MWLFILTLCITSAYDVKIANQTRLFIQLLSIQVSVNTLKLAFFLI